MDIDHLADEINRVLWTYGLSLAQFGAMVGAPAPSVKRWREGVQPQERYLFQIILVLGLIKNAESVFFDLGRQGLKPQPTHWESFAMLIEGAKKSMAAAEEAGLPTPDVSAAIVSGVKGLLALIAGAFTSKHPLGGRIKSELATRIGNFLK
jgi:hypothetical protein